MSSSLVESFSFESKSLPDTKRVFRQYFKSTALVMKRMKIIFGMLMLSIVMSVMPMVITLSGVSDVEANLDPEIVWPEVLPIEFGTFFLVTENPKFFLVPDDINVKTYLLPAFQGVFDYLAIQFGKNVTVQVESSIESVYSKIDIDTESSMAVHWKNSNADDKLTTPQIQVYTKSKGLSPDRDVLKIIRTALSGNTPNEVNRLITSSMVFASPKYTIPIPIHYVIALFAVLPTIFIMMAEVIDVVDQRSKKLRQLTYLMGLKETPFWLVNFLIIFIPLFVVYLIQDFLYVFGNVLVGTDISMLIVFSLLYVISYIFFTYFVLSFMYKLTHSIILTNVVVIGTYAFIFIEFYVVLDPKYNLEALKHVFSIFPPNAYAMLLMAAYDEAQKGNTYGWNDLNRNNTMLKPWITLMWLIIDCILYFFLFLLANLTATRGFGVPLIRFRDLFNKKAWRQFNDDRRKKIYGTTTQAICVNGASKKFGKDIQALDDVSFDIKQGEVIVLIGPNGAGKSTLINVLTGSLEPDGGSLQLFGGAETNRFVEIQKYLGVVFQDNVLFDNLNMEEHFQLFGTIRGVPDDEIMEQMNLIAEKLQLTEMLHTLSKDLSGGQKRKLCIALAMLGSSPIIVMDEPTAGVDVQSRQIIWKTIADLKNTTSIITCHALEEAEAICSRLFIMSGGKMPFVGTAAELRKEFKCGYLLRVDVKDDNMAPILEFAQSFVPDSRQSEEREDTICMPVSSGIPRFLVEFESKRADFGVESYSFSVEQLEDMLLKMIQQEEVKQKQ